MQQKSILLIEDNDQNRYLVRFILERQGYDVVEARTGLEGLELAKTGEFCLVLLDIQLPEMDGYEVARRLRELPSTADTPIVAVTSYAMVGDRERILRAGCHGYIEKPIDPANFADQVSSYVAASA